MRRVAALRLKPPNSQPGDAGFSLAETMVALIILALSASALGGLISVSVKTSSIVEHRLESGGTRAASLAASRSRLLEPSLGADCLYDVVGRRCR